MATSDQTGIIDLNEMVSLYASQVASIQLAGKPKLDNLKLKIVNQKWKEERKDSRALNSNINSSFTVTKGQVKGFNKEVKITLPEGLPVKELKFNPGQEKTENKSEASIASGQSFTGQVSLQVQLKGIVLFQDGNKIHEIEFSQIIDDLLKRDKKLPCPLSVCKSNQGLPEYVEWTIEGQVKIQ
ncbi:hypothetical protein BgiBS90_018340 [Biomphalaria glabrata]|nr:hypothetical protein BgiBS90_018340 [Biomphalaria glabrata]